jgi:hypothetical protein
MRLAVLKNRLLFLTKRSFDEGSYGASSLRELVTRIPELVRLDGEYVEFLGETSPSSVIVPARIRRDLWQAIVDSSSGRRYAWDSNRGVAEVAGSNPSHVLPTLAADEIAGWRGEFAAIQPPQPEVERWRDDSTLTTKALPTHLRGQWNTFFRSKVRDRLVAWFHAEQLPLPDLDAPAESGDETETPHDLRQLMVACVNVMTDAELNEIRLPLKAVLRLVKRKR